jgi:hypothetical protein
MCQVVDRPGLTHEEFFNLHGALPANRIETLLELAAVAEGLGDVKTKLEEARTGFPSEDFLSAVISRVQDLAKHVRGENKKELAAILADIEQLAQQTWQSAEHGCQEINGAIALLEGTA